MLISHRCSPDFSRAIRRNYSFASRPLSRSKIAAIGLSVLGFITYNYLSEQRGYKRAHPEADRSFFGFGPLKKAPYAGPFYHATNSEELLLRILRSGSVRMSDHAKFANTVEEAWDTKYKFRAYVSTEPDERFGRYILVFKKGLKEHENGSPRAYTRESVNTWIAFTEPLPTNDRYLKKVLYRSRSENPEQRENERQMLEQKIFEISKQKIRVELTE